MGLSSKKVLKLLRRGEPGRYLDQRGLYLVIASRTNAHWERRYQLDGKEHYHGLGSAFVFGLAQARGRARRKHARPCKAKSNLPRQCGRSRPGA